ncbi:2TM domain-containing protein [Gelidibacter japonicus]|uniref:2TM domain-containing protein n=1 Tax=Gelidibacter japonicus TaxID=1962232 RepID=UPI00202215A2|nr:2TM domain-containing protein [Gelidibacter japonicus]MCL8009273.1 2TM domain-containing protein [Gelidibacter japonicus]
METNYFEKERYERAKKRVQRITGFYSHLLVYVVINLMIVVVNVQRLDPGESYFQWQNFTTLFFWGIGLLAHGLSVFMPYIVLGKNWEERKIKELMEKERKSKWE